MSLKYYSLNGVRLSCRAEDLRYQLNDKGDPGGCDRSDNSIALRR
jgi:hypothetical protein